MKFLKVNCKRSTYRLIRISNELKKVISYILQNRLMDPRINFLITVSMVTISRDLSYAKVFISYMDDMKFLKNHINNNANNILHILKKSVGYIRNILSKMIRLRKIPMLIFYNDNSLIHGIKISNLLKTI